MGVAAPRPVEIWTNALTKSMLGRELQTPLHETQFDLDPLAGGVPNSL
jgi:hypothetical protein